MSLATLAARGFLKFAGSLPTLRSSAKQTRNRIPDPEPILDPIDLGHSISVSLEDSWAIIGIKGSGKTTFTKKLVEKLREAYPGARNYYLDSKFQGDFDDIPNAMTIRSELAPDVIKTPGGIQIWQPLVDDVKQADIWFERILKDGKPAVVFIDELSSIGGRTGQSFPLGFMKILKQGRGLNISPITLTQEAAYIPRQVLGQMSHMVRFNLLDDNDQRKADRLLGRPKAERGREPASKHGFFYRRLDKTSVFEYSGWQEFFRE